MKNFSNKISTLGKVSLLSLVLYCSSLFDTLSAQELKGEYTYVSLKGESIDLLSHKNQALTSLKNSTHQKEFNDLWSFHNNGPLWSVYGDIVGSVFASRYSDYEKMYILFVFFDPDQKSTFFSTVDEATKQNVAYTIKQKKKTLVVMLEANQNMLEADSIAEETQKIIDFGEHLDRLEKAISQIK